MCIIWYTILYGAWIWEFSSNVFCSCVIRYRIRKYFEKVHTHINVLYLVGLHEFVPSSHMIAAFLQINAWRENVSETKTRPNDSHIIEWHGNNEWSRCGTHLVSHHTSKPSTTREVHTENRKRTKNQKLIRITMCKRFVCVNEQPCSVAKWICKQ